MSTTRAALVIAALAVARARTGAAGSFVVGASVVDITPPLAATASSNPANCDTTGTYDGPHLFSLEEPYQDLNHNGRYDGDPSTGGPEPFLDCPTPTANGGVRPPDGRWDGIYLGGGDGHDRLPTAVLDPDHRAHDRRRQRHAQALDHGRRQRGSVPRDLGAGAPEGA